MANDILIRCATTADAEELLKIYEPYVLNTAISFEYEVPSVNEFRYRMETIQKKYPYLIAEIGGEIVGYAYAHPFVGRAAYDWTAELTIYVNQNKKKAGIGKRLYQELERILKKMNILSMYACIGYTECEDEYLTNNSMEFHKHMGFEMVGRFRKCGYKFERWYDMIWMEKAIGERVDNQPPVRNINEIKMEVLS